MQRVSQFSFGTVHRLPTSAVLNRIRIWVFQKLSNNPDPFSMAFCAMLAPDELQRAWEDGYTQGAGEDFVQAPKYTVGRCALLSAWYHGLESGICAPGKGNMLASDESPDPHHPLVAAVAFVRNGCAFFVRTWVIQLRHFLFGIFGKYRNKRCERICNWLDYRLIDAARADGYIEGFNDVFEEKTDIPEQYCQLAVLYDAWVDGWNTGFLAAAGR